MVVSLLCKNNKSLSSKKKKKTCSFDFVFEAPQFVDIPLAEEDSSDEEYRPDEEDEEETAEDVRLHCDWRYTVIGCSTVTY